jgi:hypothetical protein
MRAKTPTERRYQINVRLTEAEIQDLDRIGMREDRDRSYLVTWFLRWGIFHYEQVGSLLELKQTRLVPVAATMDENEIINSAKVRLRLRKDIDLETNGTKSSRGSIRKTGTHG